ncbi:MAG: sulfurtransferase TusA family protein [Candidatus Micrarchaeia archaeon]
MKQIHELDLRGERCPDTFTYTKIRAEELREEGRAGDILKVIVDNELSARDVPASMQLEGHRVIEVRKANGLWELFFEIK